MECVCGRTRGDQQEPTEQSEKGRWRARPSALVENGCGCFVPDLTRLTIPPCEEARHETFYHRLSRRATVNTSKAPTTRWIATSASY